MAVLAAMILSAGGAHDAVAMGETAVAKINGADGKDLGSVTLRETMSGALLAVSLKGLPPGPHGFHVHAAGKCGGDFSEAGAIYNPYGAQHGFLNPEGPMSGDLPNLVATSAGDVEAQMLANSPITLAKAAEDPLLDADGAAFVIFELPDDYLTDPEGNAGARIACGVIEAK
jgi:Cu-Zn family superoxide dismutase